VARSPGFDLGQPLKQLDPESAIKAATEKYKVARHHRPADRAASRIKAGRCAMWRSLARLDAWIGECFEAYADIALAFAAAVLALEITWMFAVVPAW
jgi:hypothetical protein